MGRILFGGTAALLICIFLSPKFIEFLRKREFGQHIREDRTRGAPPEGGDADDGRGDHLPGGHGPVPDPHQLRMALGGSVRRGDSVRAARLRRRLHEARQAPLARAAGADEAGGDDRDLAGAVVRRDARGAPAVDAVAALRRLPRRPRPALPGADLPGRGRHDQRGQSHRRPRRPRRGLRRDRAARVHRHRLPGRGLGPGDARGMPGGRVHRLPVVQRVPGDDLHG